MPRQIATPLLPLIETLPRAAETSYTWWPFSSGIQLMLTSLARLPRRRLSTARADEVAMSSAETVGSVADRPRTAEAAVGLAVTSPRTDVSAVPATHNPLLSTLMSSRRVIVDISPERPAKSSGFQRSVEIARHGPAIPICEGVSVMLFGREFQHEDRR